MTDVITSMIIFLQNDSGVSALAAERIFGDDLPESEIENMPRKAAVLMEAGGLQTNDYVPIRKPRIDIYSYGETYHEAGKLDRAIYQALKDLKREKVDNSLLHGVALSGGAFSLRDKDTGWPMKMRAVTVSIDNREIGG